MNCPLMHRIHSQSLWQVLGVSAFLSLVSGPVRAQGPSGESAVVQGAAQGFFDAAHAFDFNTMRASATHDFEMLYDGRRMTLDDFVGMLRRMQESRAGRAIPTYRATGLNTEIVGEAAYTTWASPDGRWFESMILVRSGGRWLVDRAFTMRRPDPSP